MDFAYQGAAEVRRCPIPRYPALQPYFTAMEPEMKKFRTVDYDPKAADALMTEAGAKKDAQGVWTLNGKRMGGDLYYHELAQRRSPVIAEQLRRAGFEVAPNTRPGFRNDIYQGKAAWWVWGHGASVNDPFQTLRLYHKRWYKPIGGIPLWPSRWQNDAFQRPGRPDREASADGSASGRRS